MRLTPKDRSAQLLDAALQAAVAHGFTAMTREQIATHAGVSAGLVSRHLGTMKQLRRAVMRAAVHRHELRVIAQGLACHDRTARAAPERVRQQAVASLITKG